MHFSWRRPSWRLALIIAMLGRTMAANAQDVPADPPSGGAAPHPFGELRLGTVSFRPTISITNIGYDTNVFDLSGVERQPADFTATFEPAIEMRLKTSRLDVRTLTRTAFVYYQTYKTEQGFNPGFDITIDDQLSSKLALYATGTYGYSKQRTGFEIDSRPRIFSQATTAGVRLGGGKLRVDLHGVYSAIGYDRSANFLTVNLSGNLDHSTSGGGGSVGYALSPYTTVTAGADATLDRFANSPVRDLNSLRTFVGFHFNPRAVIAGDASIGYQRSVPQSGLTPTFSGFTPRTGLTYKLKDILSVAVGVERGLDYSFYLDRPYFVFLLYEASAQLALFKHFDVGGSIQYTTLDYRLFQTAPSSVTPPSDVIRMESVTVGVPIKRQLRVGVFAQRWSRSSVERPYETRRIGLEMTVGPANLSPRGIFMNGPTR
jgi:hypothetical protein